MENIRAYFGAIVVFILSIFITQNVSAVELTIQAEPTGKNFPITDLYCKYNDDYSTTRAANCINPHNNVGIITQLRPVQKIAIKEGNYYRTFLTIKSVSADPQIFYQLDYDTTNYNLISFQEVSYDKLHQDYMNICTTTPCNTNSTPYSYFREINSPYSKIYEIVFRAKTTGNQYFTLGNGTNGFVWWAIVQNSHTTGNGYVGILPIEEFEPSGDIAKAEEKTEEATEEGQSNSDSAQSDNEQATSSLLDIAGSIIAAFGSTSSNCSMNMDLGNVDFGAINFCSGKPNEFSAIIDTVVILMLIPLIFMTTISLVHQFINLTKFAQGGD